MRIADLLRREEGGPAQPLDAAEAEVAAATRRLETLHRQRDDAKQAGIVSVTSTAEAQIPAARLALDRARHRLAELCREHPRGEAA